MSDWVETPGETQNLMEGLYSLYGLGPGSPQEELESWNCCSHNPITDKWRKINGWQVYLGIYIVKLIPKFPPSTTSGYCTTVSRSCRSQ